MTEESPDPDLKENNYRKWVEGQSTEALEKELRTLDLRRMLLQKKDPDQEARQQQEQEELEIEAELAAMRPEKRSQVLTEMDKCTLEEYREVFRSMDFCAELMADPERPAKAEAERDARLAAMEPEQRAQLLGEITPSITEQLEVTQHLEAVQRELNARRSQELSEQRKRSKRTPVVQRRREIVQALSRDGFHASDICEELDRLRVPLPQGPDWEMYLRHERPWTDAYQFGAKKLRGRICTFFSKDKKP